MKHNIIETENYLLIVSDEEIKAGNFYLLIPENIVKLSRSGLPTNIREWAKIIAHLPLNNSPVLEGVDLLPPIEDEVDKLSEQEIPYIMDTLRWGFKKGYNKAKEKYKYTEFDIIKAFEYGWNQRHYGRIDENELLKIQKIFIQSLQQPKIPVGFECDMENKIAIDGHTVIGSEPKTTTNSQGQTVLVGKYIYW